MGQFAITIKLPRNPLHNPKKKIEGVCPLSHGWCTDVTGEHHTIMMYSYNRMEAELAARLKYGKEVHITRVESCGSI